MIKKIPKEDLRLGMFIHDLNCGWMDHAFWRTRFMLRHEGELAKILHSPIVDVYIDTTRGLDTGAPGPSLEEVDEEVTSRLMAAATGASPVATPHREELAVARKVQHEAVQVVHSVLGDVRLGKQIEVEKVSPVVGQITDSILRNQGTLVSLCRIKEADNYTFQHCVSVCTLMVAFCRHMGMPREVIVDAGMGGMLHDIGKMQVPDHILNKPGKLTDPEFTVMKSHVDLGLKILLQTEGITSTIYQIAGEHHERFDGTGYPSQVHGFAISQLGRMASIVDVYDAITSNRCYHVGMEPAMALKKLFEWSHRHFDEQLVQSFIQAVGIYPVGSLVRLSSDRLAVVTEQGREGLLHPKVLAMFDIGLNQALAPTEVDLALGEDAIVSHEQPETWGVDPYSFLTL